MAGMVDARRRSLHPIRYQSNAGTQRPRPQALADVQNPNTETKSEHIRRDVNVTVEEIKIGAGTKL